MGEMEEVAGSWMFGFADFCEYPTSFPPPYFVLIRDRLLGPSNSNRYPRIRPAHSGSMEHNRLQCLPRPNARSKPLRNVPLELLHPKPNPQLQRPPPTLSPLPPLPLPHFPHRPKAPRVPVSRILQLVSVRGVGHEVAPFIYMDGNIDATRT
jgi:hypothetical protein